MRLVAISLALCGLAAVPDRSRQSDRPYEQAAAVCGLSFSITNEWRAAEDATPSTKGLCVGVVRHRRYELLVKPEDPGTFYTVTLEVWQKSAEAMKTWSEIREERQRYFIGEGAMEVPLYQITGPGWTGFRADEFPVRGYARAGSGYVGMTSEIWVQVSSQKNDRSAVMSAGFGADTTLTLILNSLKFVNSEPK